MQQLQIKKLMQQSSKQLLLSYTDLHCTWTIICTENK